MGLQSGAVTVSQYRVVGVKSATIAELNGKLPRYQAKAVALSGPKTPEKVGWVMPKCQETEDLDEYASWDMSHCRTDEGFLLRMRLEKCGVPAELLRLEFTKRVTELEKSKEKISRTERRELKENLAEELIEQALPNISYVDALWEEDTGRVLLFNSGKRIRALFEDLFRKTFADPLSATLLRVDPPFLGLSMKEWTDPSVAAESLEKISQLVPVRLGAVQNS